MPSQPKPNKSSTLASMKKYARDYNISHPEKIKKQELYDLLASKGHVASRPGTGKTARQVLARKKGKATDKDKFNASRQNLKEMTSGVSANTRGGSVKLQNLSAYDGTKVRFLNATGQATIRGKKKGDFKLELSDGRMIPMAKSWRPIWSNVEASQNKPNGRNKLMWLKKWGELPKGMKMKDKTDTITEKERGGKGTSAVTKTDTRKVSKEDFEKARKGLMANLNKYKK